MDNGLASSADVFFRLIVFDDPESDWDAMGRTLHLGLTESSPACRQYSPPTLTVVDLVDLSACSASQHRKADCSPIPCLTVWDTRTAESFTSQFGILFLQNGDLGHEASNISGFFLLGII